MNKNWLRSLWYSFTVRQRYLVRYIYYLPLDILDMLRGNRYKYVPPRGYIYTGSPSGSKDFIAQSKQQLYLLQHEIQLRPDNAVLDIGSGIGRTAISLTEFLSSKGSYEGFDVVRKGVDWCNSRIGRDYSNFNFTYVPLFNDLYNKEKLNAEKFVFPYEQESFDKVFTFSVFTHMQIKEIQNYFKEINRVLKSNGMAFSTFFLYSNENENFIAKNKSFGFPIKKDGFRLMNAKVKSGNIAIHKDKLRKMLESEGLEIVKIIDGFWKGENDSKEYQDIVIFKRR